MTTHFSEAYIESDDAQHLPVQSGDQSSTSSHEAAEVSVIKLDTEVGEINSGEFLIKLDDVRELKRRLEDLDVIVRPKGLKIDGLIISVKPVSLFAQVSRREPAESDNLRVRAVVSQALESLIDRAEELKKPNALPIETSLDTESKQQMVEVCTVPSGSLSGSGESEAVTDLPEPDVQRTSKRYDKAVAGLCGRGQITIMQPAMQPSTDHFEPLNLPSRAEIVLEKPSRVVNKIEGVVTSVGLKSFIVDDLYIVQGPSEVPLGEPIVRTGRFTMRPKNLRTVDIDDEQPIHGQ